MFKVNSKARISLGQAMRRYWPFLLGITAFHILLVFVPSAAENHALLAILFFAAVLPAMWPTAFGAAPYSFWVVASLYWFFGFLLVALVRVILYSLLGWDAES